MNINFVKMHGIGNDYIYVDTIKNSLPTHDEFFKQLSIKISNRNFGVGSDGLILISKSKIAQYRMRMFNSDGSEAEMCGNGLRCFAKYLFDRKMVETTEFTVETGAGLLKVTVFPDENQLVEFVQINMGVPNFNNSEIPVLNNQSETTINFPLEIIDDNGNNKNFIINCVSIGNPHCVIFLTDTEDLKSYPVKKYGAKIENLSNMFPKNINVEFVKILSRNEAYQRTWERGSGETLGCGTGATAVFAVGRRLGIFDPEVKLSLLGGDLFLTEKDETSEVMLKGSATEVFNGVYKYTY